MQQFGCVVHKLLCKIVCKSNSLAIVISAEFYFYHPKWKLLQQVRIEILQFGAAFIKPSTFDFFCHLLHPEILATLKLLNKL